MYNAKIVKAAIHPAIGIARIGDSAKFFVGPEVPDHHPEPEGGFRDAQGCLKKQAAKFRIYGYDKDGNVVAEITPSKSVEIEWEVEVANTKASWYDFVLAMDIPQAQPTPRRNPSITGEARKKLEIRPRPIKISGKNTTGQDYMFDDGTFMGKPVNLGSVQTDDDGHLVFLGGSGISASYDGRPVSTFANNDGWHDDVSDGPVRATVRIDGCQIDVEPAWVVCTPPNYGPEFKSIVTLHDLLLNTMIEGGWVEESHTVSFSQDILPILTRMARLQWLNYGFFVQFAANGPQDFLREDLLQRLASEDPQENELRRQVFNAFRSPDYNDRQRLALPWIYGDGMEVPATNDRQWMAIPPNIYTKLEKWSKGEFVSDLRLPPQQFTDLAQVPLKDQPDILDKATLSYCLADAFHPGCEVTWPIRHSSLYMGKLRILPRSSQDPEPDYGELLEPKEVYSGGWDKNTAIYGSGTPGGPLWGQRPGDLTRWMAVPWQTDTASCRDGYETNYDDYVPTFWPARVPNQVLTEKNYKVLMDETEPKDKRIKAFHQRDEWIDTLGSKYLHQIRQMVHDFSSLGVVVKRPGPKDAKELNIPETIYVGDRSCNTKTQESTSKAKKELCKVDKATIYGRSRKKKF